MNSDRPQPSQSLKSNIALCIAIAFWYISSVLVNIAWKKTYKLHQDILTLTTLQFLVSGLFSLLLTLLGYGKSVDPEKWVKKIVPMGVTFAIGQLCTNISLSIVSVGLTHVIKTAEPVIAVLGGIYILGEKVSLKSIFFISLLICGVVLTVVHDTQVDATGIAFAALSNIFLQSRNILIKKNQKDTDMKEEAFKGLPLFCHTIFTGLDMFVILMIGYVLIFPSNVPQIIGAFQDPMTYVVGLCFSCQHIFSYYVLANISITSHALLNSIKRTCIIVISCVVLHNTMHPEQILGISMACFFFYKYLTEKKKTTLPSVVSRDEEIGSLSFSVSKTRFSKVIDTMNTFVLFSLVCGLFYGSAAIGGILEVD